MEACEEASNNFNILDKKFPSSFPAESNKRNQEEIAKGKNFVLEEKRKRTSLNDNLQDPGQREKKINDLQSQINSLQNQPSNNDNEAKIKDLQRQIEELKKNKSIPPSVPHPEDSQQPTDNNNSLIGVFCLGFGICLALVMGYLVLSKKKKKKKKTIK